MRALSCKRPFFTEHVSSHQLFDCASSILQGSSQILPARRVTPSAQQDQLDKETERKKTGNLPKLVQKEKEKMIAPRCVPVAAADTVADWSLTAAALAGRAVCLPLAHCEEVVADAAEVALIPEPRCECT